MSRTIVHCAACGRELAESPGAPPEEREPCHGCGSLTRTFASSMTAALTGRGSNGRARVRTFYERHRGWQALAFVVMLAGALAGLRVGGWPGEAVALAFGFAGYWAGPRAVMRVQQVERGRSS